MMNKTEIIKELESTINSFQNLISSFDEEQLNTVPFEGSWTAGQVAQHISMATSGYRGVLNAPVVETERAPDELLKRIKGDFLNFNMEMKAPDFIFPRVKVYHKEHLLKKLETIKEEISTAIADLELTPTCLAFEIPGYGCLTRLEAVYFAIYHTQRHTHQLQKIKDSFSVD